MNRRRILGVVGTFALAAVVGALGAGKTRASTAAGCCCGQLCWCVADCGDVCDCCGHGCCGDNGCCHATAKVVKEKCCCEIDRPTAKAAKVSCGTGITAES